MPVANVCFKKTGKNAVVYTIAFCPSLFETDVTIGLAVSFPIPTCFDFTSFCERGRPISVSDLLQFNDFFSLSFLRFLHML